jgi:Cu+-exporting ATPase
MEDFHSYFEKGRMAKCVSTGEHVVIGCIEFMRELSIPITEKHNKCVQDLMQEGRTPVLLAVEQEVICILTISDVIKMSSYTAIQQMKRLKLNVVMLTGDNKLHAEAVGRRLGLKKVVAQVLPTEKEQEIKRLRQEGHIVAMVGDGINDAPALTSADVGIAIGAGAAIAVDSADIVLMHDNLQDAVTAICLSKAVIRNMRENLFLSFLFPILALPLAAGILQVGFHLRMNPMVGALIMSMSTLFVFCNSMRLASFTIKDARTRRKQNSSVKKAKQKKR